MPKPSRLTPGLRLGQLTLVCKLTHRPSDYCPTWLCRCSCGAEVKKSAHSLNDKKVRHRCAGCFSKSQSAHLRLLKMFSPSRCAQ